MESAQKNRRTGADRGFPRSDPRMAGCPAGDSMEARPTGCEVAQIDRRAAPVTVARRVCAALRRWEALDVLIRKDHPARGVLGLFGAFDPARYRLLDAEDLRFPDCGWTSEGGASHVFFHRHGSPSCQAGHLHVFHNEAHLAAIGLDWKGLPVELRTVNRWVTGERWQPAAATWNAFRRWGADPCAVGGTPRAPATPGRLAPGKGDGAFPPALLAPRWIGALIRSLEPELRACLRARDQRLALEIDRQPGINVLEEKSLEVLSFCRLRWAERQAWVRPDPSQDRD